MLNEFLHKILIDIFMENYKFISWQIVDGFKWNVCSFSGLMVQSYGQCLSKVFALSSQTHPWITYTKKEYNVDVAQHLVKE
jgi:hypothetical protein